MATITAAGTGNWSAGATWTGGVKPGVNDTARANGFTVTIDEDVTCTQIDTLTSGGGFTVSTGGRTINAIIQAGTTNCLTVSATGAVTINGNVLGGATGTTAAVVLSNTATLTINGNVTGGSSGASSFGLQVTASGTVRITGNVTGGSAGRAIILSAASTLTVTGNVAAGAYHAIDVATGVSTINVTGQVSSSTTNGIHGIILATNSTLNVTGTVLGVSGNAGRAINSTGTTTITVVGNVTNGSNAANAMNIGAGTFTITGTVTGGSGSNGTTIALGSGTLTITGDVTASASAAIVSSSACTLTINGTVTAASGVCAVESTSTSATNIFTGPLVSHALSGTAPVYAVKMTMIEGASTNRIDFGKVNGGSTPMTFYATAAVGDQPAARDVRYGTSYANGSLTGTCRIPAAADVAIGAAVDNTVGTLAGYDPAVLWDYLRTAAVTPGSLGERLKNVVTDDSIAALFNTNMGP